MRRALRQRRVWRHRFLAFVVSVLWPATALACPYCAQDRGPATFLIGAISVLPLLVAGAVGLYAWRIAREAPEDPRA